MALDPSISLGVKPLEVPNQLAQYAQIEQIKSARNQNQVSQMQLEQMRRDEETMRQIQAKAVANGGPSDLGQIADAYINSGNPKFVEFGAGLRQKLDERAQFAKIMGGDATSQPAPAPTAPAVSGALGSGTFGILPDQTPKNALAPTPAATPAPVNAFAGGGQNLQQRINAAYALGTPAALAWAKSQEERMRPIHGAAGGFIYDPSSKLFQQAPEKTAAPPSMVAEYTFAKTPDGGNFKGTYQDFVTARAAASRAPAQPRPEQPPVAVVDPATGKQVFVTREEALRGRMTPAAAMESLSPKEIQKREAALPQATAAVQGFESKSDMFVADLIALRDDPGLENITGPIFGRTGSVSQAGSRAQALYDKIVAKGGFQALQDLRDASKTGGALGNVSNQEGKQLTASFAAIDRRQNAADVKAAIDQAIADIQGSKTRMREAYDSTYSYKSGSTSAPAPSKPAAPNIDALLNKYK